MLAYLSRPFPLSAVLAVLLVFGASACGDNDPRSIIDSDCDPNDRFCDPLTQSVEVDVPIPEALPIRLADLEVPDVETGQEVTPKLPPIYIGNDTLRAALEEQSIPTGALRSIELIAITMEVEENTMSVTLDEIDIRIGESPEVEDLIRVRENFEAALEAGRTPSLAPEETGTFEADIVDENLEAIGEQLATLGFGFGIQAGFRFDAGTAPTGGADLNFTLRYRFTFSASPR